MAGLPWVPWPQTNRTEALSPAEIERIVQMHRESKQNAIIYVLVVLALYFVALAILVGRYLQHERDLDLAVCLGQVLERCVATCRRATGPSASAATAPASSPGALEAKDAAKEAPAVPVIVAPRKFSLKLTGWPSAHSAPHHHPAPPAIKKPKRPRPRAPQTDDESSESSSPPYSPGKAALAASSSSEDGGDSPNDRRDLECLHGGVQGPQGMRGPQEVRGPQGPLGAGLHGWAQSAHGRASPAVVSVLVCDLEDTPV